MQACWLALCVWLLGGLAQAAETIRYCDYPVYPPISWSDGHFRVKSACIRHRS